MSKRRRLYEGFAVLERNQNNIETSLEHNENITNTITKTVLETSLEHNENKITSLEHNENITNTITKTVLETSLKHNENITKTIQGFKAITGLQKKILYYFYAKAQSNNSLNTGKVYTDLMSQKLNCSIETVRTSVQRLEKKNHIIRKEYKKGRGGFSIYELRKDTYQNILLENNIETSLEHNENITNTITKTQTKTRPTNSSSIDSSFIKKELPTIEIPQNLKSLISQREVNNLLAKEISQENIELSLKYFSYDLEHGLVKSKSSPINLFYGVVRSGSIYKSLKLIDLENQELRDYQAELEKLENENQQLKQNELIKKYEEFKIKNPNFENEVKEQQTMNLSDEILHKVSFNKWKEDFSNEL